MSDKVKGSKGTSRDETQKKSHIHWGMSLYKQNIFKNVNKIMIYKSISFFKKIITPPPKCWITLLCESMHRNFP
jgi:hypothetical protein